MCNFRSLIAFVGCIGMSCAALAQGFPAKPVRIVVPFPPGGADVTFRLIQKRLSEELGQPVIVENRPGANGFIGAGYVARSTPDGYTLLGSTSSNLVVGPLISKSAPFDTLKDFTPITLLFATPNVLLVRPSLPVKSLKELVDHAKLNPGKLSYGSSGVGSGQHLDGETFKRTAGLNIVHIPYKGFGPLIQSLMADELDIGFMTAQSAAPLLASGKARLLSVYAGKAPAGFPRAPEVSEVVKEFYSRLAFIGLFGPARLSRSVLMRLNLAAINAVRSPEVKSKLEESGTVYANSPEEFAALIRSSIESTAHAVAAARAGGVSFED